jgi:tungstate transport system substrate-binding protein
VRYLSVAVVTLFLAFGARAERPFLTPAAPPTHPEVLLSVPEEIAGSGLLDSLLPYFERLTGYRVKVTTGHPGETADASIVSAGNAAERNGTNRGPVMGVEYIIAGPAADPAHVGGKTALDAFKAVASTGATWISRRDGSATNRLELALWQAALGRDAQHEGWYASTYRNMSDTLKEADRRNAYTFTDKATFFKERANLHIQALAEGGPLFTPEYAFVEDANHSERPDANTEGARALADYFFSPETQQTISEYGVAKYAQPQFRAGARP